eukprot:gene21747-22861_t
MPPPGYAMFTNPDICMYSTGPDGSRTGSAASSSLGAKACAARVRR